MTTKDNTLKLARVFGDGMILQREQPIRVWGWAAPGAEVKIRFLGKQYGTTVDESGEWIVEMDEASPGGPYEMEIESGGEVRLIQDVLIGDVWICAGQSNMELPMGRVDRMFSSEIAEARNSAIRHFRVPDKYNFHEPQSDIAGGSWVAADPESVREFSAVGYFFAKALYEKHGVPIGLINTAVGGTPVQAWMSREALAAYPSYLEQADKCRDDDFVQRTIREDQNAQVNWHRSLAHQDQGLTHKPRWYETEYDNWKDSNPVEIPCTWSEVKELNGLIGAVWFRKEFDVPKTMVGKPALLLLGTLVDSDTAYLNGKRVGETGYQYPPRKYNIAPGILQEGRNVLTVRVISNNGQGAFVKGKPYQLEIDGEVIDLTGQWQFKVGATTSDPLPAMTFFNYKPVGLYNGMIAPLVGLPIKGVIWYQGESNTDYPDNYCELFSQMISDWRSRWNLPRLPFIYVQLANFMPSDAEPSDSNWAELRQQQLLALKNADTAMAVAIDVGEWNDLHPLNKKAVGERLALGARAIAYHEDITFSGPVYRSMEIRESKVVLSFDHVDGGLVAVNGPLRHFALAGPDGNFRWAEAVIEGDHVVVWHDEIAEPKAVRYAWAHNPEGANLYNKAGLPASPFSTE